MAYDGSGNYSLPPGSIVSDGTTIDAADHNTPVTDIAAALSQVLLRSGVAPMTGPLNMGGFTITNTTSFPTLSGSNAWTGANTITTTSASIPLELISTEGGDAAGPVLSLYRNSASPTDFDEIGTIRWYGKNTSNQKTQFAIDYVEMTDNNTGFEDGTRYWAVVTAGAQTTELALNGAALFPNFPAGLALGSTARPWADAFFASGAVLNFASGAVLNFNNGDYTISHFSTGATFTGSSIFTRNGGNVASNSTMRVTRLDSSPPSGSELIDFFNDNGQTGSITLSGVFPLQGVAYNTSSDGRRKPEEHRRPIDDSGTIIDALNPIRFRWEGSDEDRIGFIAQEVVEVLPQAVSRGDNDPDKRPGDDGYQGWEMAVGSMEAILVAEIKALRARVAALEAAAG